MSQRTDRVDELLRQEIGAILAREVADPRIGFVRRELGVRLHLRRIPALHVELDSSMEHGTRVLQILDELERGDAPRAASIADAPVKESLPTPVARLPREGDTAEPDLLPEADAVTREAKPPDRTDAPAPDRNACRRVDLRPLATAVPDA